MQTTTRRLFLAQLAVSAAPAAPDGPILDLHQHTLYSGRTNEQLIAHSQALGVTRTVLLPGQGWMRNVPTGGNETCMDLMSTHRDLFLRFASADPQHPDALATLRKYIENGGIGIGELKFKVAVDGPEMRAVYDVAAEHRVPVLIHFEHEHFNLGIENFSRILKAYPRVNFIGHAQTWWGNIGADLDPKDMYPKGPVKPGGLTDKLLSDYANVYGDLSAGSGLNALTRDSDFTRGFLKRHRNKLIWGSDCPCHDGNGAGFKEGKCIGRQALAALKTLAPDQKTYRQIVWNNGAKLLRIG